MQKIKKFLKENYGYILLFAFLFASLALISYFIPISWDDYGKPTYNVLSNSIDLWRSSYGRFLGHFTVNLFKRFPIVEYTVTAGCLTAIMFLINKISNKKHKSLLFLSAFLILSVPLDMSRQTYFWISGFANFIPPVVLFLLYVYQTKNIFEDSKKALNYHNLSPVISFILGFCMQHFSESFTIFGIMFAIAVIIFVKLKYKKIYAVHIAFLIGTILGAIIMFISPAYSNMSRLQLYPDWVNKNLIQKIIFNLFTSKNSLIKLIISDNVIINLMFAFLMSMIIFKDKKHKNSIKTILSIGLIASPAFSILESALPPVSMLFGYKYIAISHVIHILLSIVFVISMLISLYIFISDKNKKTMFLFLYLSGIAASSPLILAHPIGTRCITITYFLFASVIIGLCSYLYDENKTLLKAINLTSLIITIVLCVFYVSIAFQAYTVIKKRDNYIVEQVKMNPVELILPKTPNNEFFYNLDPPINNNYPTKAFKKHHKIPDYTIIRTVPYYEWIYITEK